MKLNCGYFIFLLETLESDALEEIVQTPSLVSWANNSVFIQSLECDSSDSLSVSSKRVSLLITLIWRIKQPEAWLSISRSKDTVELILPWDELGDSDSRLLFLLWLKYLEFFDDLPLSMVE